MNIVVNSMCMFLMFDLDMHAHACYLCMGVFSYIRM